MIKAGSLLCVAEAFLNFCSGKFRDIMVHEMPMSQVKIFLTSKPTVRRTSTAKSWVAPQLAFAMFRSSLGTLRLVTGALFSDVRLFKCQDMCMNNNTIFHLHTVPQNSTIKHNDTLV